jgi:hypothetical protein
MLVFDEMVYIFFVAGYDKKEDDFTIETREKSIREGLAWFISILTAMFVAVLFIPILKIFFFISKY